MTTTSSPDLGVIEVEIVDGKHPGGIRHGNRQAQSLRPHRDDAGVGGETLRERRIDTRVQTNVNARLLAQARVRDAKLVHVLLERQRGLGAQNASEFPLLFAKDDLMPAQGGGMRRDHARNAAADDEHAFSPSRRHDIEALQLTSDARIKRATPRLGYGALRHADEAAHAADHLVSPVRHHLVRKLGIREKSTSHDHQIGLPVGDDALHLRRVGKSADGGDGLAHVLFDLRRKVDVAPVIFEHGRMRDGEAELVRPGRNVDDVDEILERPGDAAPLFKIVAALEQLRTAHAKLYGKPRSNLVAHGGQNLAGEAHTPFEIPSVLVVAMVEIRGEKLVDEPSVSGMHHDHVETRALRKRCRLRVRSHDRGDLLPGESADRDAVRAHPVGRTVLAQRAFSLFVDHVRARVLARMRQLDRGERAVPLDGVGDVGEGAELPRHR